MAVGKEKARKAYAVPGIRLAAVKAGIRYPDRLDLVLVEIAAGATTAGVFTGNAFCAAPVLVARRHLNEAAARYLLINTGNANAGTGEAGERAALQCCQALARYGGCASTQVLPFSTGVIGELLPSAPVIEALPQALSGLSPDNWQAAARGIMTTDTRPKIASRRIELEGCQVTVTGFAKGAGMIKPNMATMLAFVFTDALVAGRDLQAMLQAAVNQSFNRMTVDGDTSTNDGCMLVATGACGVSIGPENTDTFEQFTRAINDLFQDLAVQLIRDAEGASKFVTVKVSGGKSSEECLQVAYCVAESPLVKTALFASDPNWGRILAAVGRAGLEQLQIDRVAISLGDTAIVANGGRDPDYTEARGQVEMDKEDICINIDLARGEAVETVWTSDLSHEYVRINAEYRT